MGEPAKKKHPGGRPTKYNAQFHPGYAESLTRNGLTLVEIADKFNVTVSTVTKWMTEHQEFSESIKKGREDPDDAVEKSLFQLATGYKQTVIRPITVSDGNGMGSHIEDHEVEEHFPPVPTAQIFWLKNRRPAKWRDKQEIEHSGGVTVTSRDLSKLTEEELDQLEKLTSKIEPTDA